MNPLMLLNIGLYLPWRLIIFTVSLVNIATLVRRVELLAHWMSYMSVLAINEHRW